jgi:VWFA-related protein
MAFCPHTALVLCLAPVLGLASPQTPRPQQPPAAAKSDSGGTPPPAPAAQQQPEQSVSEMQSQDEQAVFKTRVNLVMVPVVVRDSKGRTIPGLTKADFQLFDKGKPQTITRFSAEKSGAQKIKFVEDADGVGSSAASKASQENVPQRFIAYLFDDIHSTFGDLAQARQAAIRHISNELSATDRAGLFTTSGLDVVDFTDDRAQLINNLNLLQPRPIGRSTMQQCPDVSFYMADLIVNKHDASALQAITADVIVCQSLTGPAAALAPTIAQAAASQMLGVGEQESHVSYEVLKDVLRRMSATPGQRIVVLASPGFLTIDSLRSEETDVIDRAIRSNITINGLDIRGLYVGPGYDVSQRTIDVNSQRVKDQYARFAAQAEGDTLAEISYGTGGTFFQNNNSMDEGFRRTAGAPDHYYILGFSPQNLRLDGSYHALKVSMLKTSGHYEIESRKGYYSPKRLADAAETAKQEIEEALFSRDEVRELPVDLHTQFFKGNTGMASVTVMAHLDVKHFRYHKADGRNNNTVTIVSSLFDRNGNIVQAITKKLEMRLKDETLEKRVDNGLTVRTAFSVKPGTYVVRLVVRDGEAQMIAAENSAVDIP